MAPGPFDPFIWTFQIFYKVIVWLVAFIGVKARRVKKATDDDLNL